jgi:hypothetical protein
MEPIMLSRLLTVRHCVVLSCLILPNLGTSCPSTPVLDPTPGVSVAGTYSGTVGTTTNVVTQLPRTDSTNTTGSGSFSITLAANGKPLSVQIGYDNHGSPVSTFVVDYASMTTGQTSPFPSGSTADGYTQTGGITAKEVTFSTAGFHIVVEDNGSITYTSGSQTGITTGGLTTSTYDGKVDGNVLTYTEVVTSNQTLKVNGAMTGYSDTVIRVSGSLTKQ